MSIQWDDNLPIYKQLRDHVVAMILDGTLKETEALPSVRTVAADYKLNPITVSKAYQSLVDEGIVEKKRGLGMFVMEGARLRLNDAEKQRFLEDEWPQITERIERLGLDTEQLLAMNKAGKQNG